MTTATPVRIPPRTAPAAVALATSSLLLFAFPIVRPFFPEPLAQADAGGVARAATVLNSQAWVVSHLLAGAGFLLLLPALCGVYAVLASEGLERRAWRGLLLAYAGTACLLLILGAETFGLSGAGKTYAGGVTSDLVAAAGAVRSPVLFVVLLTGLALLAAGSIVFATVIRRSQVLPHAGGVVLAIGLSLWVPLLPQPARIVDGLLIGLGGCWLASALWRHATPREER